MVIIILKELVNQVWSVLSNLEKRNGHLGSAELCVCMCVCVDAHDYSEQEIGNEEDPPKVIGGGGQFHWPPLNC